MEWNDKGFLLSKNRYNENSILTEIFTSKHGKVSGIIFGATSKKGKSYLELGNELHVNYNYKNENKIGYFKVEILQTNSPFFFENKKKLFCVLSALSLVKILSAEGQKNYEVYQLINELFENLKQDDWLKRYVIWELGLLKVNGYHLDLRSIVKKKEVNNKDVFFVIKDKTEKIIPSFLLEKKSNSLSINDIQSGLKLTTDYINKSVLRPNNVNHPLQRLNFISVLNT